MMDKQPKIPVKLVTDKQILNHAKWAIRSMEREAITPEVGKAVMSGLMDLVKLRAQLQVGDDPGEGDELLQAIAERTDDLDSG